MAETDFITELLAGVLQNPSVLNNIAEHPYSAMREATGEEYLTREQASEGLAALSLFNSGSAFDFGSIASLAGSLLASNDNSAHNIASSLFGGGVAQQTAAQQAAAQQAAAQAAAKQSQGALNTDNILTNIASFIGNGGMKGVDLSDGFDLNDIMAIAGNMLTKK